MKKMKKIQNLMMINNWDDEDENSEHWDVGDDEEPFPTSISITTNPAVEGSPPMIDSGPTPWTIIAYLYEPEGSSTVVNLWVWPAVVNNSGLPSSSAIERNILPFSSKTRIS